MSTKPSVGQGPGVRRVAPWLALGIVVVVGGLYWASQRPAHGTGPARSSAGEVMFVLTPRAVSDGHFLVDVQVNTHSGDLAQLDLQAATELRVAGQTLRPVAPVTLRGHHARGRLEFALARAPDAYEIVIRGVRNMGDVTFRWP